MLDNLVPLLLQSRNRVQPRFFDHLGRNLKSRNWWCIIIRRFKNRSKIHLDVFLQLVENHQLELHELVHDFLVVVFPCLQIMHRVHQLQLPAPLLLDVLSGILKCQFHPRKNPLEKQSCDFSSDPCADGCCCPEFDGFCPSDSSTSRSFNSSIKSAKLRS